MTSLVVLLALAAPPTEPETGKPRQVSQTLQVPSGHPTSPVQLDGEATEDSQQTEPSFYEQLKSLHDSCWKGILSCDGSDHDILVHFEYVTKSATLRGSGEQSWGELTVRYRFPASVPKSGSSEGAQWARDRLVSATETVRRKFQVHDSGHIGVPIDQWALRSSGKVSILSYYSGTGIGLSALVKISREDSRLQISLRDISYSILKSGGARKELLPVSVNLTTPENPEEVLRQLGVPSYLLKR